MTRWWSVPALVAVLAVLHSAAPRAAASIHSNLTIIMTTLGTDGTTTTTVSELPPGSSVTVTASDGSSTIGGGAVPPTSAPQPGSAGGNGGGNSGGPSGASGNPGVNTDTSVTNTGTTETTTATPTETPTPIDESGPTVPNPPVLEPVPNTSVETPQVPDVTIPVPIEVTTAPPPLDDSVGGGSQSVAETPEPGTLTLLALSAVGGLGWARRRRQA